MKFVIRAKVQGQSLFLGKVGMNYLSPLKSIVFTTDPKFFMVLSDRKQGRKVVKRVKALGVGNFRVERKKR